MHIKRGCTALRNVKSHASLVLVFLLSLPSTIAFIPPATASLDVDYEEWIFLEVRPWNGQVLLGFVFAGVDGPLDTRDFEVESSFTSILTSATYSPEENRTVVMVSLNSSVIPSVSERELTAEMMKRKFERLFEISLPYSGDFTSDDTVTYSYRTDQCPIQRFREVFLTYKPSEGFGKIVTSSLIEEYVVVSFDLMRKQENLEWTIMATVDYPDFFKMSLGQEYLISLRELTGYSEPVQSSSGSRRSVVSISISQVDRDYRIVSLEAFPSEMEKQEGTYGGVTSFHFEKTITGSSVEDLSVRFGVVSPSYVDPTTIAVAAVAVVVAILCVVGFILKKRYQ